MNGEIQNNWMKVSITDLTRPPEKSGFYQIYAKSYWAVTEDNCVLFYKGLFPQCNVDKNIMESIVEKCKDKVPAVRVELIPVAYVSHNCDEYSGS